MKKEEFYFDSRDGESRIHAVRYLPDTDEVKGIVQIVHGVAEHVERYEEFAGFLTDRGFVVTGEDHLGHGKSVKKDGVLGYFCEQDPATVVVRDVHRLKKMTQELYPMVPYILYGHSMGSFIVRNYMSRYGKGISGAIISGTGNYTNNALHMGKAVAAIQKKFKGSKHISKFMNDIIFNNYNKAYEPARTPVDWFSKDTAKVDAYVADPLCGFPFTMNGVETLFELIERMNDKEEMAKIPKDLPVYIVSGDKDPVGECGKGVQEVYDSLKAVGLQKVEMKLFEDDRHEILNETNRVEVMQNLYKWIMDVVLA